MYHDGVKVDEETSNIQVDNNFDPSALGGIWGRIRDHTGGNINQNGRFFDGILDEFRVTNSVLSADYIKTSYNTQNDPTNFVREGIFLSESISLKDIAQLTVWTPLSGVGIVIEFVFNKPSVSLITVFDPSEDNRIVVHSAFG